MFSPYEQFIIQKEKAEENQDPIHPDTNKVEFATDDRRNATTSTVYLNIHVRVYKLDF